MKGKFGSVLVVAPTGAAACNIQGETLHSALCVGVGKGETKSDTISSKSQKDLQQTLDGVQLIIVDEFSMLSPAMLHLLDGRLRLAFPEESSKLFGGKHVIMSGDFYQLPPVASASLYEPSKSEGKTYLAAI